MQHCSVPKELAVCGNKQTKKQQKIRGVMPFGKKVKQIIHMWNFYECLKTV